MSRTQRRNPDAEQNRRIEATEAERAMAVGAQEAQRQQVDPRELLTEEFIDTVTDPDVERDGLDDGDEAKLNVEQKLAAHLSKQLALGNITRETYEKERILDNARRRLANMSYRRPGGTGSKCTGRTRKRMTNGDESDKPLLTDDLSEQLDASFEVKKSLRSNSVGGWFVSKFLEAQVVTRSEGFKRDPESGSGGILNTVTGGLLG